MKCKKIQIMISLYVDNQLTAEENQAVKEHIEKCDKCRKFYDDLVKVKSIMSSVEKKHTSANFTDSVMAKINSSANTDEPAKVYPIFMKKYIAIAATFLFVVLGSSFYMMQDRPDNESFGEEACMLFDLYDDCVDSVTAYEGDVASFLYIC